MLKAIIFDMDGVIVDSEPLHKKAYYKMFQDVNIVVSSKVFALFTGQATLKICQTLCEDFNLKQAPIELVALKRKHFNTGETEIGELKEDAFKMMRINAECERI